MLTQSVIYDLPREKLQTKGASTLTSSELLQVLIGSGNARIKVGRIAKKALKLLSKHGVDATYDQLLSITGLGPAHVCQIIAAFELASRYPMSAKQLIIDSKEKMLSLISELRVSKERVLVYISLDGARRIIAKRSMTLTHAPHPSMLLRRIFAETLTDNASRVIVAMGARQDAINPSMFELSFARDLKAMAALFNVTVQDYLLINETDQRSLKAESW